jgi:hypothetical protein
MTFNTDSLLSTRTVRQRAQTLLARARRGESAHFVVHDEKLQHAAQKVAQVTRQRYPSLNIPYHSRWRHFEAGGVDRRAWLEERMSIQTSSSAPAAMPPDAAAPRADITRALIDLVVVSVLLDAGAGAQWHYQEAATPHSPGQSFTLKA